MRHFYPNVPPVDAFGILPDSFSNKAPLSDSTSWDTIVVSQALHFHEKNADGEYVRNASKEYGPFPETSVTVYTAPCPLPPHAVGGTRDVDGRCQHVCAPGFVKTFDGTCSAQPYKYIYSDKGKSIFRRLGVIRSIGMCLPSTHAGESVPCLLRAPGWPTVQVGNNAICILETWKCPKFHA